MATIAPFDRLKEKSRGPIALKLFQISNNWVRRAQ